MKKLFYFIAALVMAGICLSATMKPASEAPSGQKAKSVAAGVPTIRPTSVELMPDMTYDEYEQLMENDPEAHVDVFSSLYFEGCSWYCGGQVDNVTASSNLNPQAGFTYDATNAHDFDHESVWATKGKGIGEYLTFYFASNCPRITSVAILNGHVKSKQAWSNNSRVKSLLLYFNDKPYRLLELEDSRSLQYFDLDTLGYGPDVEDAGQWTLKFEIRDVYPGKKYGDCVIADFIFDGIDVH
ncbi:MAG: hypothetical protein IKW85_10255 [Muribaculaceae bacterium]|nr:hypothetical protein [Muribaculaceae bacterium]